MMMMMVDVLIGWWEKERLAPPQLLARFATLIVKIISAELFVCKARQLLPTSDTGKSIQDPTNLVDQVKAIFKAI